MISQPERSNRPTGAALDVIKGVASKGRVLIVDDHGLARESMQLLLEPEGYQVSFAGNGREALARLQSETAPDIIVLDLRMPVMDGWEFRAIQKDDPKLSLIPVLAISADWSAQAAAISAHGYLRKPAGATEILAAIEGILLEQDRQKVAQPDESERLTSLGRLAAGVGHEINNPLTLLILNLGHSIDKLRPSIHALEAPLTVPLRAAELEELKSKLVGVADMLEECQVGSERIRGTVAQLKRLSGHRKNPDHQLDVHKLIEKAVSLVWNQIRHRAQLIKTFGTVPMIHGNGTALGQVFLNMLLNATHAIQQGEPELNEIRIVTRVDAGANGAELVVEISDTGEGIAPEMLSHVFEPFFTTRSIAKETGLGLSVSRQTVIEHGGRMVVESELTKGTVCRVFLPVGDSVPRRRAVVD